MPYAGISHRMETPDILRRELAAIYTEATIGVDDGRHVSVVRPDGESVANLKAARSSRSLRPTRGPSSLRGDQARAPVHAHRRRHDPAHGDRYVTGGGDRGAGL